VFAAPVSEGGLLDAAADVVDRLVGESDGVEVVDDQGGPGEVVLEGFAVSGSGVQGGQADPVAPVFPPFPEPVSQNVSGTAGDHVEDPVTVQVDDLGGVGGAAGGGGVAEPFLIHPDRLHPLEAAGIVDRRVGVISDRPIRSMPAHPESSGSPGDGVAVGVDHPGQPTAGPLRQHRPRGDLGGGLRPGAHPAISLWAAPAAFRPHQHGGPSGDRQVRHQRHRAAMPHRPGPAAPTADHVGDRLHPQPQLAVDQLADTSGEPGQTHQHGGAAATLDPGQGPLLLQTYIPQNGGALAHTPGLPNSGPGPQHPPHPNAKSPITCLGILDTPQSSLAAKGEFRRPSRDATHPTVAYPGCSAIPIG
jgi:hypothetical protein